MLNKNAVVRILLIIFIRSIDVDLRSLELLMNRYIHRNVIKHFIVEISQAYG
jgi:hypothetical protein